MHRQIANLICKEGEAHSTVIEREGLSPVGICRQPLAPYLKPLEVLKALAGRAFPFLLESAEGPFKTARYSIIGCDPLFTIRAKRFACRIRDANGERTLPGNPVDTIKELLAPYRLPHQPQLPQFFGGMVGLFSYDMKNYFEELPDEAEDDLDLPDCFLICVDTVVVFDRMTGAVEIISSVFDCSDGAQAEAKAFSKVSQFLGKLNNGSTSASEDARIGFGEMTSTHTIEKYSEMVVRAKEYIAAGDIFQANLSQRLKIPFEGGTIELYRRLTRINPSPFAFYMDFGEFQLVSCSPERLVRVIGDFVETRPIAGTRPRGRSEAEDEALREELILHPKERAEHIMIVDMARNDIGRVCTCGTVRPDELMVIERYSHVFHIVSNIVGTLAPGRSCFDVLAAVFPGASITGVPKIRCMEIIDELESVRRGPYTGSLGWISYTGDMDLNIIIRTFVIKGGNAYIQVGGGIVADSEPEREYQESLNKAQALIEALRTGKQIRRRPKS
ncbi:MAG: anthranilate synthase component I family protein [Candidatus Abyssobacteria bacterium SURF_5]|uniref:Anthranilate synthase component I family protein n=1 Tax=Abyssobacteria bacterium (strain SURF_5) TaxID=2093360 RepID=A0A3A4NL25_ABYX5|nr:MAG: anthranilate synthase component I family protein [Candidatus Abyssubacteria bacterium SURF_5]